MTPEERALLVCYVEYGDDLLAAGVKDWDAFCRGTSLYRGALMRFRLHDLWVASPLYRALLWVVVGLNRMLERR